MVYLGQPSRACQTCKTRRIKCDEQKPACTNCTKTGRLCPGLPDETDLIFRTENPGRKKTRKSQQHSKDPEIAEHAVFARQCAKSCGAGLFGQRTFNPSLEDVATTCFFNAFIMQSQHLHTNSGFMELAKPMFMSTHAGSALHLAVDALSLAALSKWPGREYLVSKATRAYSQALKVARKDLKKPSQATGNAMLETILVLSLYETTTGCPESVPSWANHIEGAAALLIARGADQIHDPETLLLFRAVRTQMLVNCIQQRKSMPKFPGRAGWIIDADKLDSPAAAILDQTIRLASVVAKITPMFSSCRTEKNIVKIEVLLEEAYELMEEMAETELSTPSEWQWRSVANLCDNPEIENIAEAEAWPGNPVVHVYQDLHGVCIRNNDRISHLLCCSAVCDAVKWLLQDKEVYEVDPRYLSAKAQLLALVDEICASVPYHWYGQDLLGEHSPGTPRRRTAPEAIGGYSLIWPLYTASNIEEVPALQRQWLKGRFSAIGRHYGLKESDIIYSLNRGRTGASWSPLVKYGEYMGSQQGPCMTTPMSAGLPFLGKQTSPRFAQDTFAETESPTLSQEIFGPNTSGVRHASKHVSEIKKAAEGIPTESDELEVDLWLDWSAHSSEMEELWPGIELPDEQDLALNTARTVA